MMATTNPGYSKITAMNAADSATIEADVRRALAEDVGDGDRTALLVPASKRMRARVISREAGVLCGRPWFERVFSALDPGVSIRWQVAESDTLAPEQTICTLNGPARALLTGERTALNFLQTLSGTATTTARYVEAVRDSGAVILDTRKTLPGLRLAQKYAVRCGGGQNHRMGLYDMVLIKENHIAAAGSMAAAVRSARDRWPRIPVEAEVETRDELAEALSAGADIIMLDNFDLAGIREAVKLTGDRAEAHPEQARPQLEVSGNVGLEGLAELAATGVDRIAVGALTKHVQALDLSMRFES